MARTDLTVERVRHLFDYNPTTGALTRLQATSSNAQIGKRAGSPQEGGYRSVFIDGRLYKEHRVIWLHVYGEWPKHEIDHINGKRDDNRIWNLRDVEPSVNCENRHQIRRSKKCGSPIGVRAEGRRFRAAIYTGGAYHDLGLHDTREAAHAAYVEAKRLLHRGCTI